MRAQVGKPQLFTSTLTMLNLTNTDRFLEDCPQPTTLAGWPSHDDRFLLSPLHPVPASWKDATDD